MKEKVVIGLSGGVDSSVAAYLLKEQGYDVIGVTMHTWRECGEMPDVQDAKKVADYLQIPFYVCDFSKGFKEKIVDYFTEEYLMGRTPNPCVVCNRYMKWEALLQKAKELGAFHIATGHYAQIKTLQNGRLAIAFSKTAAKDQTYVLYDLTQEQLKSTMMPLGTYEKETIREIAKNAGIPVAQKPDSQEICFIPDHDYAGFIKRQCGERVPKEGHFVTKDGAVLGMHKGITHYTIGQRKGLGLAMGHPVVVTKICPDTNEVVIGENEDVFTDTLLCDRVNYMGLPEFAEGERLLAKIRYGHKGTYCKIMHKENGILQCRFEEPVRAVTPGQTVVFYHEDYVAGGGRIIG